MTRPLTTNSPSVLPRNPQMTIGRLAISSVTFFTLVMCRVAIAATAAAQAAAAPPAIASPSNHSVDMTASLEQNVINTMQAIQNWDVTGSDPDVLTLPQLTIHGKWQTERVQFISQSLSYLVLKEPYPATHRLSVQPTAQSVSSPTGALPLHSVGAANAVADYRVVKLDTSANQHRLTVIADLNTRSLIDFDSQTVGTESTLIPLNDFVFVLLVKSSRINRTDLIYVSYDSGNSWTHTHIPTTIAGGFDLTSAAVSFDASPNSAGILSMQYLTSAKNGELTVHQASLSDHQTWIDTQTQVLEFGTSMQTAREPANGALVFQSAALDGQLTFNSYFPHLTQTCVRPAGCEVMQVYHPLQKFVVVQCQSEDSTTVRFYSSQDSCQTLTLSGSIPDNATFAVAPSSDPSRFLVSFSTPASDPRQDDRSPASVGQSPESPLENQIQNLSINLNLSPTASITVLNKNSTGMAAFDGTGDYFSPSIERNFLQGEASNQSSNQILSAASNETASEDTAFMNHDFVTNSNLLGGALDSSTHVLFVAAENFVSPSFIVKKIGARTSFFSMLASLELGTKSLSKSFVKSLRKMDAAKGVLCTASVQKTKTTKSLFFDMTSENSPESITGSAAGRPSPPVTSFVFRAPVTTAVHAPLLDCSKLQATWVTRDIAGEFSLLTMDLKTGEMVQTGKFTAPTGSFELYDQAKGRDFIAVVSADHLGGQLRVSSTGDRGQTWQTTQLSLPAVSGAPLDFKLYPTILADNVLSVLVVTPLTSVSSASASYLESVQLIRANLKLGEVTTQTQNVYAGRPGHEPGFRGEMAYNRSRQRLEILLDPQNDTDGSPPTRLKMTFAQGALSSAVPLLRKTRQQPRALNSASAVEPLWVIDGVLAPF